MYEYRNCNWCHRSNDVRLEFCPRCGHSAQLPRLYCVCASCTAKTAELAVEVEVIDDASPTVPLDQTAVVEFYRIALKMLLDQSRDTFVTLERSLETASNEATRRHTRRVHKFLRAVQYCSLHLKEVFCVQKQTESPPPDPGSGGVAGVSPAGDAGYTIV